MRTYPGKLLVFGEYVILLGAPALSAPIALFSGHWQRDARLPYAEDLLRFAASDAAQALEGFDASALESDVRSGWRFASNIPQGYGLGSSGAVVAGLYDRYVARPASDPSALQEVFARMESHFHGQSSGLDPLTSYLNSPLQTGPGRWVNRVTWIPWDQSAPRIFLLNTGIPRQTAPLVSRFRERLRSDAYRHRVEQTWVPAHLAAMEAWVRGEMAPFWPAMRSLSQIQFELADFLIPEPLKPIWLEGLRSDRFILKLCGAGGGGFFLGVERPQAHTQPLHPTYPIVYLTDDYRA